MSTEELSALPGSDLMAQGIKDLKAGRETVHSLLVTIAETNLRASGLDVPQTRSSTKLPEHRLYALLRLDNPLGAHSAYNALIRRLVSFEHALSR